jgi:hypothetical protein
MKAALVVEGEVLADGGFRLAAVGIGRGSVYCFQ